jgi:hypothetical protein
MDFEIPPTSSQHRCKYLPPPDYVGQQTVPRLANEREDYLIKTLGEYKRRRPARL